MQVSVETTSELSRKMTVQVPEEKIQEQVNQRLKSMAGKIKLDGFRPGKVPQGVIQKKYGKEVRDEVVADLIKSSFYDAVREEKLSPVSNPSITPEITAEGQGLKFVADFEVMPEFVLYPIEHLEVDRYVSEVTDDDLEEMLSRLRSQHKTWQASENPAALGDRVNINFEGQVEGESFTNGKVENSVLVLGSNQSIPGVEENLIGSLVGSHKVFSVELPQGFGMANLAGKQAELSVDVVSVEEGVLPELNAQFVQNFGIEDGDVEVFRTEIRSNLVREMNRALHSKSKESVMDALFQRNDSLSLPGVLVNDETTSLVEAHQAEAGKRKQSVDVVAAKEYYQPLARRRVALGLLLNRIIETKQVTLDSVRVRQTIEGLALSYEEPEEVVSWYYSNKEQLEQVQRMVIEDQIVDLILEKGKVSEKWISFSELMKPLSANVQG